VSTFGRNTWRISGGALIYTTAAAGEAQVLHSLLAEQPRLLAALLVHAGVVAALSAWLHLAYRRQWDKRIAAMYLVSIACLGPIGFLGATLSSLVWLVTRRSSASKLSEYYAAQARLVGHDPAEELYKNLTMGREKPGVYTSMAPVIDALRWGTVEEKYRALAGLARRFRTEFTPALRFALASDEPTVRIQAASMVAKIEKEFTQQWLDLRDRLARCPNDAAVRLQLAQHLDRFAHTGMLDAQRETEVRQQSAQLFREYLQVHPDSAEARVALGRLLTRLGDFRAAVDCLASMSDDRVAQSWYCQALYGLGRFDELRDIAEGVAQPGASGLRDCTASPNRLWSGSVSSLAFPAAEVRTSS
jgi:thioredoxin-like negative regulator of GroEL